MKLRAGVIGVGYLGRFHAQKYRQNPLIGDLFVCDSRKEAAETVAKEVQGVAVTDPRELFSKVDLVTIAASTRAHFELTKMFLSAGIPVNVEKPIAASAKEAEELVRLARERQLPLAVGHIERFNPAIVELRQLITAPRGIELIRHTPFRARGADVSVLHDLMIHDLDLLTWLGGADVRDSQAVAAKIITSDWDLCDAHFTLANGLKARISVSRVSGRPQRSIRVIQDQMTLFADTGSLEIERITPIAMDAAEPLKIEKWTVAKKDALQAETDAWIDAVRLKQSPLVSGEDGLRALRHVETLLTQLQGRA